MGAGYAGVAKGVGTSKIVGRVHAAPMKIGGMHITISITVLEDKSMEFLFGLDNLRRHQVLTICYLFATQLKICMLSSAMLAHDNVLAVGVR